MGDPATRESEANGREVAAGVYRFGSERVNWYLVEAAGGVTVVDAGFPSHWDQFTAGLRALGRGLSDVEALVLTHGHPDHIGFARRLRDETGAPVYLHEGDVERAAAGGDPPLGAFLARAWRPGVARYLAEVAASGGTSTPPVTADETVEGGERLDVPGRPDVVHVPGHTAGEVALWFEGRNALLCGDALATTNLATWRDHRPQLLPAWVDDDHGAARSSLSELPSPESAVLLPGHGDPWVGAVEDAVRLAREE
jgi:glyoxylase-like metal-dependent hydrolase (beta-lactamase superfamily II)